MRSPIPLCLALISGLLLTAPARADDAPATDTSVVECTFSNNGYSGLCAATETVPRNTPVAAACRRILACLNDSQCTKTYCNATTVRGGWQLVKASRQKPSPFKSQ